MRGPQRRGWPPAAGRVVGLPTLAVSSRSRSRPPARGRCSTHLRRTWHAPSAQESLGTQLRILSLLSIEFLRRRESPPRPALSEQSPRGNYPENYPENYPALKHVKAEESRRKYLRHTKPRLGEMSLVLRCSKSECHVERFCADLTRFMMAGGEQAEAMSSEFRPLGAMSSSELWGSQGV